MVRKKSENYESGFQKYAEGWYGYKREIVSCQKAAGKRIPKPDDYFWNYSSLCQQPATEVPVGQIVQHINNTDGLVHICK